jgi:beta-galactosidase
MPTVAHTRQSFTVDGRRVWIVAASLNYARIDPADRPARLADVRQAGCNAVEVPVPWMLHEPRAGHFDFEGAADLPAFLRDAQAAGLQVILRAGPYIGEGYAGGGLPAWLSEIEPPPPPTRSTAKSRQGPKEKVSRTASEVFLDRVSLWFKALFDQIVSLQVSQGGPILLMQIEHRWLCDNHAAAEAYLGELVRMARESGVDVPLLNANDLWADGFGTIDTWQGSTDLLANLRQLRTLRDHAPRMVSRYEVAPMPVAEQPRPTPVDPDVALHGLASILAAGAQPVIAPFHGGSHFGALGGRIPGPDGGTTTFAAALGAPVGEAGDRGPLYRRLRRLAHFATSFGHVFADLDPEFHSTVQVPPMPHSSTGRGAARVVAVPLRGTAGRILFVFADRPGASTTLLLDDGLSLPVELGDQCVGWFALDVDLGGRARLDFSNCCPAMFVDRSILVFAGAKGADVILSIGDTPLQSKVPTGRTPEVTTHQGITVVIVSQEMLDETHASDDAVYVNVSGLDVDGRPRATERGGTVHVIRAGDTKPKAVRAADIGPAIRSVDMPAADGAAPSRTKKSKKKAKTTRAGTARVSLPTGLADWEAAPATPRVTGDSPRFARIKGPSSLAACGARSGLGWYRVAWRSGAARKRTILPLDAGNRIRFWMDGAPAGIWGVGPDAVRQPLELKFGRGDQVLTALVQTMGRVSAGNDLDRAPGLTGPVAEVKKLSIGRSRSVDVPTIDPFALRGFIEYAYPGAVRTQQYAWTVNHAKKTPLAIHIADAPTPGFVIVNDHTVGFHAGASGLGWSTFTVDPAEDWFKRGKNELRFAPLESPHGDGSDVAATLAVYDVETEIGGENREWSFERWACPADADFAPASPAEAKAFAGDPAWWRCRFDLPSTDDGEAVSLDLGGMGLGAVLVNGRDLGRFAISAAGGTGTVQTRMHIPRSWLRATGNVLAVFDETGAAPTAVRVTVGGSGDLDG